MIKRCYAPILIATALFCSCSKPQPAGSALHATVVLRDGRTLTGSVVSSSTGEIRLSGDDNVTQSIPMAQVSSVQYDNGIAAQTAGNSAMPLPAVAPPMSAPQPPAVAAPQSARVAAPPMQRLPVQPHETAPPQALEPPPAQVVVPREQEEPEPAHINHYHPPVTAITTRTSEVAAGTRIPVRTEETIDSRKAAEGQTFAAEITANIRDAAGAIVIPRGSNAAIIIRSASKGRRFRGSSDLVMDLATISVEGQQYQVSTGNVTEKGRAGVGANRRTGEFAGGGAVFGAIIGAIAGGGKGAAIGAGSGAGAGALTQILTKGPIKVPVETVLTFELDQPLVITVPR